MKLYIGTKSPLKLPAVIETIDDFVYKNILKDKFEVEGVEVESGVNLAPTDESTYQGAYNRAIKLYEMYKNDGEAFVGIETGIVNKFSRKFDQCISVIIDKNKKEFIGISSELEIPEEFNQYLEKDWKEIEFIINKAKELNINYKDTIGIYTNGIMKREQSIKEAFRNAFLYYTLQNQR